MVLAKPNSGTGSGLPVDSGNNFQTQRATIASHRQEVGNERPPGNSNNQVPATMAESSAVVPIIVAEHRANFSVVEDSGEPSSPDSPWLDKPGLGRPRSLEDLVASIASERIRPNMLPLEWTIDDAINAAMHFSFQVNSLKLESLQQYQQIGIEHGRFDIRSFMEQRFRDGNDPVGNNFESDGGVNRIKSQQLNLEFGLEKELRNGGTVRISDSTQFREDNSGVLDPNNQIRSGLNLQLSKQLLRGSGKPVAMNSVLVARYEANSTLYESKGQIANLLQQVTDQYWVLVIARANYFAIKENISLSSMVLKDLMARQEIDADPNLIYQARIAIKQLNLQLQQQENEVAKASLELLRLTNANQALEDDTQVEIIPTTVSEPLPQLGGIFGYLQDSIHNRPEISAALERIRSAKLRNHLAINDLLPTLDFVLNGNFDGIAGERDFRRAGSNRFDSNASYELGFNFEFPLANRQSRFRKRQIEIEMNRLKFDLQDTIAQIKNEVSLAFQDVTVNSRAVQLQNSILQDSLKQLSFLEVLQYETPRENTVPAFQLSQILDAQREIANAKSGFIEAIANASAARIELARAAGTLVSLPNDWPDAKLDRNHILLIQRRLRTERKEYRHELIDTSNQVRQLSKIHLKANVK